MNYQTKIFAIGLAVVLLLTSCLGDDNESSGTGYSDVAITAFNLGTLNRYTASVSANTGNDTILKTTITSGTYPMTIDHIGRIIYNQDSLPIGTDVAHVVCTVGTKNSGIVALGNVARDSLALFNSSDSVDFTNPRLFRVFSTDGKYWRDYDVRLNVATTTGDTFSWVAAAESNADIAALSELRPVYSPSAGAMMLFGLRDGATAVLASTDGAAWQTLTTSEPLDADAWHNVVATDEALFTVSGGHFICSVDGQQWQTVDRPTAVSQLIAASTDELYGLDAAGTLLSLGKDSADWTREKFEDDAEAALFPLSSTSVAAVRWPYAPSDSTDYVLLCGRSDGDAQHGVVWRKLAMRGSYAALHGTGQWVYMPFSSENRYTLPCNERLTMAVYDASVLAIGDEGTLLQSRDQGLTWKPVGASTLSLPSSLTTGQRIAIAAGADGELWIVSAAGQVFVGKKR